MKFVDRAIDYIANRVLDRIEARRRPQLQNNVTINDPYTRDTAAIMRDMQRQTHLDMMRYSNR